MDEIDKAFSNKNLKNKAMKTSALYFILFASLAISCSKDGTFENLSGLDQQGEKAVASGNIITVFPGGDETVAINEAFESAKTIGKGAIVKLMPGTYEIDMIEVREFFGTFTGSGKEVTVVTNHPDLDQSEAVAKNKIPALIRFVGGDVKITNMEISLRDLPGISQTSMWTVIFTDYTSDFTPVKKYIRAQIDGVNISGFLPFWNGDRSVAGVLFGVDFLQPPSARPPMTTIDADVSNSYFGGFDNAIRINGCKNCNFNIGDNHFDKSATCFATWQMVGANVKIHDNLFEGSEYGFDEIDLASGMGTDFEQVRGDLGVFNITHNIIKPAPQHYSIGLFDIWRVVNPDDPRYMKVMVDQNYFYGTAASTIVTFAVKNGMFSNNIFTGPEGAGMGMDIYGLFWYPPEDPLYEYTLTEGCRFLNNKFQLSEAVMWFEFDTRSNLVVGELENVDIYDFGENNRFNERKVPAPSGKANGHMKMLEDKIKWMQDIINR